MPKTALIVGIDPGTTSGYAILDINGKVTELNSVRDMGLDLMVKKIVKHGIPVLVGTDKSKVPDLIDKFSAKTGAIVVTLQSDLKVGEKKILTDDHEFKDSHQMDALASAFNAFNAYSKTLNKVKKYVTENKKEELLNELIIYVIKYDLPIKAAIALLENQDEESVKVRKAIEERHFEERDFLLLYKKLKRFEQENKLLKNFSKEQREKLVYLEGDLNRYQNKLQKKQRIDSRKIGVLFDHKDKKIHEIIQQLEEKKGTIENLEEEIKGIYSLISNISQYYVLKKLKNLGLREYEARENKLNISYGDILLVEDINVYSEKIIGELKEKVTTVLFKNNVSKGNIARLPFHLVNVSNLSYREFVDFALIKKSILDKKMDKKDTIHKIIEDYKRSRA
ncbi:MAG: DUF460 domain-containing protein [Candidatus Woesearchaeota archaeon]